ncbi:hypothetical protein AB1Y20_007390 [Prymnesium parvum]|uniref:Beta-hexosaminidase n=1 Tax=Prymnesium parvum TaxID=97485 RepID=A0AB34IVA8_PRYPA
MTMALLLALGPPAYAPRLPAALDLWPLPSNVSGTAAPLTVLPSASFFSLATPASSPLLTAAFDRYAALTFPHAPDAARPGRPDSPAITALSLTVHDLDESHPQLATDESYSLSLPAAGGAASAEARTVYGALRALETFSQLVRFDFDAGAYAAAAVELRDAPRFAHRGLMIDTARHYQPLASIRRLVDSLPFAKLNVLHWHMVDSQSFPFEVVSRPKLWEAAYAPSQRYTQADVAAIVEYGRLRGVRVMVEFDMPGHAASWCKGYPEICPSAACTQPLNVASNATFDLIGSLLGEVTGGRPSTRGAPSGLFPDNFVHLGGDEVDTACWTSTPSIASWLAARGWSADDGYAYFVKQTAALAMAAGRRPVQWSEVYDHFKSALPKPVIVHVWKDVTNVTEVLANGYNVLRNVGYDATSWYLDNLNVNWSAVYSNEPCHDVPDALCPGILGGHGEMWGETVDASDVEQTVWPRLAAIAEKLWSPRDLTTSPAASLSRLQSFRCLLNERGVAAAPVNNANARAAPPGPGSCLAQRRRSLAQLKTTK